MKNYWFKTQIVFLLTGGLFLFHIGNISGQQMPDENFCNISANLIFGDSVCMVGVNTPWEFNYDDGTYEDMISWAAAGGQTAVRFTPPGYPVRITGGKIDVGDGTFPAGADFMGTDFRMIVYDDDDTNQFPGTPLDSVTVTVDRYNWIKFGGLDVEINDGDFYLAMKQLNTPRYAAPVGVDTQSPTVNRSYVEISSGGSWETSPYQDIMIRALTCGGDNDGSSALKPRSDDTFWYQLARVSDFDPNNGETPEDGTLTVIDSLPFLPYEDTLFYTLPLGYYAYAVRMITENIDTTDWYYSNAVENTISAVDEHSKLNQSILVYPNPAKDIIHVQSEKIVQSVQIINALGRKVFLEKPHQKTFSINTGFLTEGFYSIWFTTNSGVQSRKIVISRPIH